MRNRSISSLPSYYVPAQSTWESEREPKPGPLEVFDITYLHFHSLLELGVCTQGRGCCIVEDREYPFVQGDVQIIFPFQRHLSRSEGGEYSQWLWCSLEPLSLLGQWGAPDLARMERLLYTGMGLCGIIDRKRYPLIAELIARVALPGEKNRRLSCLHTLIEELAAESEGMPPLALRPGRRFVQLAPALEAARQALQQGEAPLVSALAEACGLSPAPFRRAFRQVLGQSPQEYIQACQMKKAQRQLLLTDEPITQIAFSVGYQDVSGFNRVFLRHFGMPPRAYRACGGQAPRED